MTKTSLWAALLAVAALAVTCLASAPAAAQTIKTNRAQRATVRVFALQGVDVVEVPSKTSRKKRPFGLPRAGHGSGLLVTPDGLVLTAKHVVHGARMLAVRAPGHEKAFGATVIYEHPDLDFAFIAANGQFADHIDLPDKPISPSMGDEAVAIGYPLDSREELPTQMTGSLAGITNDRHYKLSMSLNPGNSGGPVFSNSDVLLGIAIKTGDPRKGVQGLSIAVPLEPVLAAYPDVAELHAASGDREMDNSIADLTAELVMAGADGLYDEVTSLAEGPTRTKLYNALEAASKRTKNPDVLALLAAYFFDLAGAVLERHGAFDVADMPPGKPRAHAAKTVRLSVSLAERAVDLDAGVKKRSPFIQVLLRAAHAPPEPPPPQLGYQYNYGGMPPQGPDTLPYSEGDPIPDGYVRSTRVRKGLVIGGAVTFGTTWLLSVVFAAALTASEEASRAEFDENGNLVEPEVDDFIPLYIPVAGPFITIETAEAEAAGVAVLILDGIAQTGGLAMFIAGLAAQEDVLRRAASREPHIAVTPLVMPSGHYGLGVSGQF